MNLLAIKNLSSVVCYAVAAGLILILGLGFFVTLLRHKRTRKWYDVFMLILAFVVLFAGLVVGAFAVICKYKPLSLECARLDKKLLFLRKDKKLFSVPAIGYAVTLFEKLALAGLIVPFAIALLALLTIIVIFAKTKKKKKIVKTAVKTGESEAPADAYAKSEAQNAKTSDVSYAERSNVPHETREEVTHAHREGVEHEKREQLASAEERYSENGEKPQLAASEPTSENEQLDEQEIMDEVSKLMDESLDGDVDGDLERAIEEGYAMIDDFAEEKLDYELADEEEEGVEVEGEEEPLAEEEAEEAEEETDAYEEEEVLYEETEEAEDVLGVEADEEGEAAYEEEAFEEDAEAADAYETPIEEEEAEEPFGEETDEMVGQAADAQEPEEAQVPEESEDEDAFDYASSAFAREEETLSETEEEAEEETQAAVADEKEEEAAKIPVRRSASTVQPPLRRRGVYTTPSPDGTRLRTVVRRPAARSVEEIEARAEAITGAQPKAANAVKANPASTQKETAAKKAPVKRAPAKKTASKPQTKAPRARAEKTRAPAKTVEPEEAGLPLTRKYIILNRRSAAAVFNNYLNQKREQEKAELTGSLNTIIIK